MQIHGPGATVKKTQAEKGVKKRQQWEQEQRITLWYS